MTEPATELPFSKLYMTQPFIILDDTYVFAEDEKNGEAINHELAKEDNLSDYDEVHGMIGSNGKLYHSDPTVKDSDDDGLTDKEEMGGYYELYEDGSIYCDGKKVTISGLMS